MKKKLLLLLSILPASFTMAEDVLQVMPFETTAGVTLDNPLTFKINLNNSQNYQALEFNLYVPQWLTLYTESVEPNKDRLPGPKLGTYNPYHSISIADRGNGHYYITVVDINEDRMSYFTGNEGTVFSIYYETANDVVPGIYPIRVEGTVLGIDTNNGLYPATSVSYVKIGTPAENSVYDLGGTADNQLLVPSFVQTALNAENNVMVNETCKNLVLTDGCDFSAPKAFTATNATYTATVSASLGYKTLVLPYNCAVPAGFEAYEVGSLTGNTLDMVQVQTITADKPVILKNAGTATLSASDVTVNATSGSSLANGMLEGTYSEMLAPVGSYVLQNIGGNVAFYPVAAGQQPTVGAFRAYLSTGALQAKSLKMNFDSVPTDIDAVEADTDVMTYNINGQRISDNSKGLRIVRSANGVSKRIK